MTTAEHIARFAPIIGALIAAGAAVFIAQFYTKKIKRIEATLEFHRSYRSLLTERHRLNLDFYFDDKGMKIEAPKPTPRQRAEARSFFNQLFGLLLNEFDFFEQGLIGHKRFRDWMEWNWLAYNVGTTNDDRPPPSAVLGIMYKEAWREWKDSLKGNRFVNFLDRIHEAKELREIDWIVKSAGWRQRSFAAAEAGFGVIAISGVIALIMLATTATDWHGEEYSRGERRGANLDQMSLCDVKLFYGTNFLNVGFSDEYDRAVKEILWHVRHC